MNPDNTEHDDLKDLRKKAEEKARTYETQTMMELLPEDAGKLLHELRVHQIELEIQNEELRRSQEELEESRSKYFDLYELAPVGYLTVNDKGLIIEANLTAATLFRMAKKDLIKSLLSRFIVPEDQDIFYRHRKELFETGKPQVCELRMIRNNCDSFWARFETNLVHDKNSEAYFCRAVMSDITALKLAEEEQQKLQQLLTESNKMESIGRLAGGVAHDFNNMLAVILGNAELAMKNVMEDEVLYEHLKEISKAAKRSAEVVKQLLAFARKQLIAPIVLDINETIEKMLKMIIRLIGENIELIWTPGSDIWTIKMDPSQIDQILVNLCVNARDSIFCIGKIKIETKNVILDEAYCASHREFVPGSYITLTMSDNGCGMNKKVLNKIFEPFFTTKGVGKGTGLGLATIHGIVKQNKGFIDVYSEPGHGSTFKIYLPRYDSKLDQVKEEKIPNCLERGSETVLLVEDEPSTLKITKTILKGLGYNVIAAKTPMEAIQSAKEQEGKIQLLITDVIMPEMDGKDLSAKILSLYPNIKCIFMSGYTDEIISHQNELKKSGHFIQKPFSIEEIASKVRKVLLDVQVF